MLSATEAAALREFVTHVREALGSDLRAARLFGSRARGEGHEYADLDVALIVSPRGRARRYAVYDLAFDVGLAHGVEISPLVIEEERLDHLRRRERLIAHAIDVDGIPLT